ncbi:uncharacterized protein LOC132729266 [Ruditapes philippinarum]|uniref:uncharacterized protein LOC132729266 n=1 Tax=Ruditapes philippinarum TaxID=129788 RepID=UPI00295BE874|nr:uncharacterized protein LOC132729266 [Ruditapes philippinarum]
MSNIDNTPKASNSNKRDLSSPEDLFAPKKNKYNFKSPDYSQLENVLEMSSPEAPLALDEEAVKSIASALKESIQAEVCSALNATVESIVKGVVDGLQLQINTLQKENEDLKSTNLALTTRIDVLELRADAAEQYSRRDNLRITGVSENKDENTDQIILDLSSSIDADLSLDEIAVSHRLGKPRSSGKPRDIIVKFASRRSRNKILKKRALLKTKGHPKTFVNEDLTKTRSELLYEARQLVKNKVILGAWTTDGTIIVKSNTESIHRIVSKRDLSQFYSYTVD